MSRDLIILAAALFTWGIGEGLFFDFRTLYLEELGADPVTIGSILSIVGIAMAAAHIPAGYLADRIGRRPLLYAAWSIGLFATWVMALAPSIQLFVTGAILYGFTYFVLTPLNSYVTAARGTLSVARAITLISAAFNTGAVLGPILGGWIGDRWGLRTNYYVAAIIFIISTILVLMIRAQPVDEPTSGLETRLRGVLTIRFVLYMLIVFIAMFVMFIPQPLSPNFLQNERGISLAQIGILISAAGVGVVVFNLLLGQINVRLGFVLTQVLVGIFALLLWKGTGFPWYLAGYFFVGSYRTARSLAPAQGRALVSGTNMGIAYGLIETMSAIALVLAPLLAGYLYSWNPVIVYPVSIVAIGIAFGITLIFTPIPPEEAL